MAGKRIPAYTLRVKGRDGRTVEIGPFRSERAMRQEAEAYREQGFMVKLLRGDTSRQRDDDYDEDRPRRRSRDDDDDLDELEDEEPDRPPRDTHPWFKDLFGGR